MGDMLCTGRFEPRTGRPGFWNSSPACPAVAGGTSGEHPNFHLRTPHIPSRHTPAFRDTTPPADPSWSIWIFCAAPPTEGKWLVMDLLEREAVLQDLAGHLQAAVSGPGRLALVRGEAGDRQDHRRPPSGTAGRSPHEGAGRRL